MEQYSYHEETGKITLEKNASSTGADILLMSLDEWSGFASDVRQD